VQWSLVDFVLGFKPSGERRVTVEVGQGGRASPEHPVELCLEGVTAAIGNGLVEIELSAAPGELVRRWTAGGRALVPEGGFDVRFQGVHGFHRSTDYNPAAYACYMTGDESWVTRVGRPFRGAFRCGRWPWAGYTRCTTASSRSSSALSRTMT